MKRYIKSSKKSKEQLLKELKGVYAAPGADGRLYITTITRDKVSKLLEFGFVPCDPISGKEKTGLSNREIYDLWYVGELELCNEAVIDE